MKRSNSVLFHSLWFSLSLSSCLQHIKIQLVIPIHIPPLFKIGIRLGFSAVKHSWPWGPSLMFLYSSPHMYYWPMIFGIFPVIQFPWLRNDWCLRSLYYWVHHIVFLIWSLFWVLDLVPYLFSDVLYRLWVAFILSFSAPSHHCKACASCTHVVVHMSLVSWSKPSP